MNAKIREMVEAGYTVENKQVYFADHVSYVCWVYKVIPLPMTARSVSAKSEQQAIDECYSEWKRVTG